MNNIASIQLDTGWTCHKGPVESLGGQRRRVLTFFGTRPEVIKLAPVIHHLEALSSIFETINVTSAQHTDLLYPLIRLLDIRLDYDLHVMSVDQTPNLICSRVLASLDSLLSREQPDLILVQGDTTTALGGALAGFQRNVPVGHVEAGLRSHNSRSPYPEEMNRRMIGNLATYHFAATTRNRDTLMAEGVSPQSIFVTGNPVVDSLKAIIERAHLTSETRQLIEATRGMRRIVLTTHRRESFGELMSQNLKAIRRFVATHEDVALIFPVHPNPSVVSEALAVLSGEPRCYLFHPLNYDQFILLLAHSWLIVSDSGGVQEEAPTLGKPLLILRENTERPEAMESGIARLVGGSPERLSVMLEEAYRPDSWTERVGKIENPFGRGDSGQRIAQAIAQELSEPQATLLRQAS
jgi:UDP-N-acetylglucosamine 2-epimerase (non-hydrolysing)